jgi:hypothetical protein
MVHVVLRKKRSPLHRHGLRGQTPPSSRHDPDNARMDYSLDNANLIINPARYHSSIWETIEATRRSSERTRSSEAKGPMPPERTMPLFTNQLAGMSPPNVEAIVRHWNELLPTRAVEHSVSNRATETATDDLWTPAAGNRGRMCHSPGDHVTFVSPNLILQG